MTTLLMFAASTREDSCNKKLINIASQIAQEHKIIVDLAAFDEFYVDAYDGDIETQEGLPEGALEFIERLKKADACVIASPEYNFSTPGTLKNLIDWVSRAKPMPFANKPILLLSASPSLVGGNRGLLQTRIPLTCCGAYVYPDMFSLPNAYEAFDESGKFKDDRNTKNLSKKINAFLKFVKQLSHS